MPRWRPLIYVAVAAVFIEGACGGSTTPAAPSTNTFHAEVTDPIGDAVASPGVPNPPDLTHGTVDVSNGTITFSIQFAPGTFDRLSTLSTIELDTDQDRSTGIPAGDIGIDYVLFLSAPLNQARIQRAMPVSCATGGVCYVDTGTASFTSGTDSMSATVPLATLGSASGRLSYRVFAYVLPPSLSTPTVVADVMPDLNLPAAHVP